MQKRLRWRLFTVTGLLAATSLAVPLAVSVSPASAESSTAVRADATEAPSAWGLWREDAYYRIIARNSGGVFDIPNGQTAYPGHDVQIGQWPYHGGDNQLWRPVPDRDADGVTYYTFHRKDHYDQCLSANHRPGLTWDLVLSPCKKYRTNGWVEPLADKFLFWPEHQADGWWAWRARGSNRVWDISWNSVEAGAPVVIYPKSTSTGAWNQQFMLYYVADAGPTPPFPTYTPPAEPTATTPPPPSAKPDLVIASPPTYSAANRAFTVTIKNQGTAATGAFQFNWRINGYIISTEAFLGGPAGASETKTLQVPSQFSGAVTAMWSVDIYNTVSESNENNNEYHNQYDV